MEFRFKTIACVIAGAAVLTGAPALAEDFYKGKTITLMVPSSLGASMGLYGRVLAAALEKYTPGNPNVILQERPGAGGVTGTS
jgi:tripartite-type tricarboxylate transporter receptor subunit TctC